jgi:hypothetical protein
VLKPGKKMRLMISSFVWTLLTFKPFFIADFKTLFSSIPLPSSLTHKTASFATI